MPCQGPSGACLADPASNGSFFAELLTFFKELPMQEEAVNLHPNESVVLTEIDARVKRLIAEMDVGEGIVDAVTHWANARDREAVLQLSLSLDTLRGLVSSVEGLPAIVTGGRGKAFDTYLQGILEAVDTVFERIRELDGRVAVIAGDSIHRGVVDNASQIRAVLRSFFDRIEQVRWQVFEEQADVDLASGRVKSFKNSASAKAFLHSTLRG